MLQMRPNCESCDTNLCPDSGDAYICSFECTFCRHCADSKFGRVCPNCGGNLLPRPARPDALLDKYPASSKRITKNHGNNEA